MTEQDDAAALVTEPEKPRRGPPSRLGKGPTPTSWRPGQSGNPKGRAKHGHAFSERVRERVDPDLVIELALRVAENEALAPEVRLAALWPLVDRGWVRPPTDATLTVSQGEARPLGAAVIAKLSDATLRELVEAHRQAELEPGGEPDAA